MSSYNSNRCPFCKTENHCAINKDNACWCNSIKVPQALIKLVPSHLAHKACICHSCIDFYTNNPAAFKPK